MRRREFIGLLPGAAAALPVSVHAQQPARMRHIAIWIGRPEDAEAVRLAASFRQRLQVLGWTEGRNIRTDYRWVVADIDRGRAVAKEIIEQKPEVILADSTPVVAALMRENSGIPVVFVNVSDPIDSGFIPNLRRPAGMITGFISNEPTLGGKWLQLLREIAPGMRHAGFIFNPDTAPYANAFLHEADAVARLLKVELSAMRAHDAFEIERAISTLGSEPSGGLIVLPEVTTNAQSQLIIRSAAYHKAPAIYAFEFQAIGGGLMSYGVELADLYRGAAVYVDRILRGDKPGDLPVQAPTRFRMVLNVTAAKALALEVPTATFLRADEVIE